MCLSEFNIRADALKRIRLYFTLHFMLFGCILRCLDNPSSKDLYLSSKDPEYPQIIYLIIVVERIKTHVLNHVSNVKTHVDHVSNLKILVQSYH